jgi:hypothetical protein
MASNGSDLPKVENLKLDENNQQAATGDEPPKTAKQLAKEAEKAEKLRKFNEKQEKKEQQLAEAQVLLNFLEKFYLNKYFRKKRKLIKRKQHQVQLLPNIQLRQKLERKKVIKINI